MSDPADEKIELLVRSVLAAVDARLVGVRSEIQAVISDVEQRHQQVLAQIQALEQRWESQVSGSALFEHFEELHQRSTIANERFALIDQALGELRSGMRLPATIAVQADVLDNVDAPLVVAVSTGQVPVVPPLAAAAVLFPRVLPVTASHGGPSDDETEPIDMSRLADLLSERLGSLSLEPHQPQH